MSVLETLTCGACGVDFALPARRIAELRETGADFYCPNGHPRAFPRGKTRDELERELAEMRRARNEWREEAWRLVRLRREHVAELRTCPLCGEHLRGKARVADHLVERHGASARCIPLGLPAPKTETA